MEVNTLADKVVYTRVPSIKDAVNNGLVNQLIKLGYDYDEIFIRTEDIHDSKCGCTKLINVIAYTD